MHNLLTNWDILNHSKVKKFITRDAVVFPIDVDFERHYSSDESGDEHTKVVKRSLFIRMNQFPQKKIMTFNKHVTDFSFNVNYNELEYLSQKEVRCETNLILFIWSSLTPFFSYHAWSAATVWMFCFIWNIS